MQPVTLNDFSGGLNGVDIPISPKYPLNQFTRFENIDMTADGLTKRLGMDERSTAITGGTAFGTDGIRSLTVFDYSGTTNTNGLNSELWAWSRTTQVKRTTLGGTWADVTLNDAWAATAAGTPATVNDFNVNGIGFNGKNFLCYNCATDRLHAADPPGAGGAGTVRRVGINPGTTAATVANQGAGAYPATLRYYRIRFYETVVGVATYNRYSEPTPSVSFTPSGAGASARVTRPTAPGEGETAWIVEASSDNVAFFQIQVIAIGTTTFDDTEVVANYGTGTYALSEPLGYFTLIPNLTQVITDGNRLIGFVGSRVYWTPVLGSLDKGDDERIVQTATIKPYVDLNTNDSGKITALARTVGGVVYAFKLSQTWRLTPTGDPVRPYIARKISNSIGALNVKSVAAGEDAYGNPAVYFIGFKGLYRIGAAGIEYCGRDIEHFTQGEQKSLSVATHILSSTMGNDQAFLVTTPGICSHIVYHPDRAQVYCFLSLGVSATPNHMFVFTVTRATRHDEFGVRGGWSRWTTGADTKCSVLWNGSGGGKTPWTGGVRSGPASALWELNFPGLYQDEGVSYQALIQTRHPIEANLQQRIGSREAIITGETIAGSSGTLMVKVIRDNAEETNTFTTAFVDAANSWKVDATTAADAGILQFEVGDSAAQNIGWRIWAMTFFLTIEGER